MSLSEYKSSVEQKLNQSVKWAIHACHAIKAKWTFKDVLSKSIFTVISEQRTPEKHLQDTHTHAGFKSKHAVFTDKCIFLWVYTVLLNSQSTDEITLDPMCQQLSTETGWGCIICFTHYENWSLSKVKLYSLASWYQRKKGWKRTEKNATKTCPQQKTSAGKSIWQKGNPQRGDRSKNQRCNKTTILKSRKKNRNNDTFHSCSWMKWVICIYLCCVCMYYLHYTQV